MRYLRLTARASRCGPTDLVWFEGFETPFLAGMGWRDSPILVPMGGRKSGDLEWVKFVVDVSWCLHRIEGGAFMGCLTCPGSGSSLVREMVIGLLRT